MTPMKMHPTLRLPMNDIENIISTILEASAKNKVEIREISIFGSRADLSLRGGDIDIYIQSLPQFEDKCFSFIQQLRIGLADKIGEQKFDIVVDCGQQEIKAFIEIVKLSKKVIWTPNI